MVEYFLESPSGLGMWLVELLPTVNEGLGSIPRTRGKEGRKALSIIALCSLRSTRRLHGLASQAGMKLRSGLATVRASAVAGIPTCVCFLPLT